MNRIIAGRFSRIMDMEFPGPVEILADPSAVGLGDVQVIGCYFRGRVVHTPNIRFDNCFFADGHELWRDPLSTVGVAPDGKGTE